LASSDPPAVPPLPEQVVKSAQQGPLSLHSIELAPDLDAFTPSPQCACIPPSASPRMLYGCELWAVTKTEMEMEMLERSHRNILRTIQGFPLRCPNSGLLAVIGVLSITDLVTTKRLLFVHSIVSLPEHSLPRQVLLERLQAPNAKVWLPSILASSDSLDLPSANDFLQQAPSKSMWKRVVSGIIRARAKMNLLEQAERKCSLHLPTQMDQRPGIPSPIWTITHNKDLLHLTSKTNFRV